ncbi:MAG: hypothetical protein AAB847_01195 [Patescibacteria group bacterium]
MDIVFLCFVFGFSGDLDELNKYFVREYFIEDNNGKNIVQFADWEVYNTEKRHLSAHDNGKRLRLKSKLGYWLENIPLYHNRFYNECIEIFLEIERELPRAQLCMKNAEMNTADIKGLKFIFPYQPVIDEKDSQKTKFWCSNGYSCTADGKMVIGAFWVNGIYHGKGLMEVTLSPEYRHIISVHEYIHASGYTHYCDTDNSLENKIFQCAERPRP